MTVHEQPVATPAGPLGQLAGLVGAGTGSERLRKATAAAVIGQAAWRAGRKHLAGMRERSTYTVAVAGDDVVYEHLHMWLLDQLPPHERRSVALRVEQQFHAPPVAADSSRRRASAVTLRYDSSKHQVVVIDGHQVEVGIERHGGGGGGSLRDYMDDESRGWGFLSKLERMVFTCRGPSARDAVIRFIEGVAQARLEGDRTPSFHIASRWGDWQNRDELGERPLSSVVLRAGQVEDLVGDLHQFLGTEAAYRQLGLPWHRGYLLSGPPGTGKTSLAKAIANHFDLDVYYIPLSDLTSDTSLMNMISSVRPGSMLLLEDIDVMVAARDREGQEPAEASQRKYGVTLSGLLNSLDGVGTPHGLITVMTTNFPEVLDDALIRPGRIDRRIEVGYLNDEQLRRMLRIFVDGDVGDLPPLDGRELAPAQVTEVLKRHLNDREGALTAVKALVSGEELS